MRSSTSASDPSDPASAGSSRGELRRAAGLLLAGCAIVALGAEATARLALDHASKMQQRIVSEYRGAQQIGCDRRTPQTHILVVGNSLLDEGVQFERVREELGNACDARRLVVEQTAYFDWYYGIKALLDGGARPDIVVLVLSPSQWVRPDSRGDYAAQYLFQAADLPDAARDLGLNATQQASFMFARVSKFWGARAEMRNFILIHLMPNLGRLMNFSSFIDPTPIVDDQIAQKARARIERLNRVVRGHGGRLVILVPPVLDANDGAPGLARAARPSGVPVIRPVASGTYGKSLYRDTGFHLNAQGAAIFTEEFVRALRTELRGLQTPGVIAASERDGTSVAEP
jgi:hypothetical protein